MSDTFTPHDLTVIIPTHGRPDILRRTLDGLAAQTVHGFDVVVVVDGTDQPVPPSATAPILGSRHRWSRSPVTGCPAPVPRPCAGAYSDQPDVIEALLAQQGR